MKEIGIQVPGLLVSVRSAAEARTALAAGCDVLDVKEPSRGPMGMADVAVIGEIVEQVRACKQATPVSVALGEAAEWSPARQPAPLPPGIAFLKLGTSQLGAGPAGARQFSAARDHIEGASLAGRGFGPPPRWIAVAYADYAAASAPTPEEILEIASACRCAGLLIDTFSKRGGGLRESLDQDRLETLAVQCRARGLMFALAGRLQAGDLPQVLASSPDLVGIRSAACRTGDRNGPIDSAAIRAFREALDRQSVRGSRDFSSRALSFKTD